MGGLRQVMQTGERAFALFVASLWPGVGERMVRAQEERERVEREAREAREAEERRQEEERVKREEEAEKINREFWEGEADVAGAVEREGDHGKGKGKERAVDVAGDEKDAVAGPSS